VNIERGSLIPKFVRVAAAGLGLAVAIAGCSGPGGLLGGDSTAAGLSPVDSFFATQGGSEAALAGWQTAVQESVAVCMRSQGFTYEPAAPPVSESEANKASMSVREWTEQFGYGLANRHLNQIKTLATSTNQQVVGALPADQQNLYIAALTGPAVAAGQADINSLPLNEQGCSGQGVLDNGGESVAAGLAAFNQALADGQNQVNANPVVTQANAEWSRCMADKGYDFANRIDARTNIDQRLRTITEPLNLVLGTVSPDHLDDVISGDAAGFDGVANFTATDLHAIQEEEKAVANADLECYEQHLAAVVEPVRNEMETALIEEFRPQLEAVVGLSG